MDSTNDHETPKTTDDRLKDVGDAVGGPAVMLLIMTTLATVSIVVNWFYGFTSQGIDFGNTADFLLVALATLATMGIVFLGIRSGLELRETRKDLSEIAEELSNQPTRPTSTS